MMSHRQNWQLERVKHIHPEDGYLLVVNKIEKRGIFDGWERMKSPGMGDIYLDHSIDIACGNYQHPYMKQFLDWSIAHCERGLADPRFEIESENQQKGWKNESYYRCHGLTLETLALACAFKFDAEVDADILIQAAKEKTEYSLNTGHWDYPEQFSYLVCVQFYLIMGNIEQAHAMLKTRKKFKQVQRYYDWLKAFINTIPNAGVITDTNMINTFQDRFDEIRSPLYQPSSDYKSGLAVSYSLPQLRLQLALIKQRYIIGKSLAGNWQAVIGYICE